MTPDYQSVSITQQTSGAPPSPDSVLELLQIDFEDDDCMDADVLMGLVSDELQHGDRCVYAWDDERRRFSWGADGGLIQQILINLGTGIAGAGVWQGMVALVERLAEKRRGQPQEMDAEAAVMYAAAALKRIFDPKAMGIPDVAISGARLTEDGWEVAASIGGHPYEVEVDSRGHLVRATRSEGRF